MRQANLWATEFEYRRTLLKVLLLIIVVVGAIFTIHNWSVGLYILAIVEFATICFAMDVLSIHKTSKNIHFWASAFLATLYLVILFGVYASKFSASLYSWLFIIPVLSYLLLGTKRGNIFSAVFVSLGIAVLYAKHINSDGAVPFIAILNVLFCILAIWGLSYTYESKRASI